MNTEVSVDVDMLEKYPAKTMLLFVTKAREAKKAFKELWKKQVQELKPLLIEALPQTITLPIEEPPAESPDRGKEMDKALEALGFGTKN